MLGSFFLHFVVILLWVRRIVEGNCRFSGGHTIGVSMGSGCIWGSKSVCRGGSGCLVVDGEGRIHGYRGWREVPAVTYRGKRRVSSYEE